MSKVNKEEKIEEHSVPEWLKAVQINSWEAELLISALLLYMLFRVPDYINDYRNQHYNSGEIIYMIFGVFTKALEVLRIGYSIHIIARGIWVASVGLSYIYPKSLDMERLRFKGRFRKELENDVALDKTVKNLEKIASLSYAISFMISGMLISAGLLSVYLLVFGEFLVKPAVQSGNGFYMVASIIFMFLYIILILVAFVDFITNGYFRRESSISKPFYYVAMVIRYMTLSFIYNRINLTIISNLKKWQGHMVPIAAVAIIGGYMYINGKVSDWDKEQYLESSFDTMSRMNYENLRIADDPVFATIQNDIVSDNVLRLFVNTQGKLNRLYAKDSTRGKDDNWNDLSDTQQGDYANKYVKVSVDGEPQKELQWKDYKHPISFDQGFLNYINISNLENGMHTLTVAFDTTVMDDLQKRVLLDSDPPLTKLASIDFFKTE